MLEFLGELLSSDDFMPHGHCYLWRPGIVWLHVVSDTLIALAYTSIPFTLYYFVRRRRDLPFRWMFLCFAGFIIACGATHLLEVVTLWTPIYRLSGLVKAITAVFSIVTAVLLARLVPLALALPSPEDLRRANNELREAQAKLTRSNVELAASNEELEAFGYSVAHDLRAPLRAIHGFATILREDYSTKLDDEGTDCIDEICGSTERMGHLIDALLGLSRVTRSALRPQCVDLSAMANEVIDQLRAGDPGRQVEVHIESGLEIEADPELLHVLLENLLGNAWKFTSKSHAPRIELAKEAGGFLVRDNGAGFDPAYAKRMFGAFQRFHRQEDFEGTGIGLATVKRVVNRHGGRVWAEGEPNAGATFHITLGGRQREEAAA